MKQSLLVQASQLETATHIQHPILFTVVYLNHQLEATLQLAATAAVSISQPPPHHPPVESEFSSPQGGKISPSPASC